MRIVFFRLQHGHAAPVIEIHALARAEPHRAQLVLIDIHDRQLRQTLLDTDFREVYLVAPGV